jgi:homoserine dehydrogenase
MSEPLRIALAGLGTVGGVIRLIETNADLIARRAGRRIEIVAVAARDRSKDRGVDLSRYAWEDDMTAMAARRMSTWWSNWSAARMARRSRWRATRSRRARIW